MTNWKGESRKVAIGRLKVETRPMIMVEFQGKHPVFTTKRLLENFVHKTKTSAVSGGLTRMNGLFRPKKKTVSSLIKGMKRVQCEKLKARTTVPQREDVVGAPHGQESFRV